MTANDDTPRREKDVSTDDGPSDAVAECRDHITRRLDGLADEADLARLRRDLVALDTAACDLVVSDTYEAFPELGEAADETLRALSKLAWAVSRDDSDTVLGEAEPAVGDALEHLRDAREHAQAFRRDGDPLGLVAYDGIDTPRTSARAEGDAWGLRLTADRTTGGRIGVELPGEAVLVYTEAEGSTTTAEAGVRLDPSDAEALGRTLLDAAEGARERRE